MKSPAPQHHRPLMHARKPRLVKPGGVFLDRTATPLFLTTPPLYIASVLVRVLLARKTPAKITTAHSTYLLREYGPAVTSTDAHPESVVRLTPVDIKAPVVVVVDWVHPLVVCRGAALGLREWVVIRACVCFRQGPSLAPFCSRFLRALTLMDRADIGSMRRSARCMIKVHCQRKLSVRRRCTRSCRRCTRSLV